MEGGEHPGHRHGRPRRSLSQGAVLRAGLSGGEAAADAGSAPGGEPSKGHREKPADTVHGRDVHAPREDAGALRPPPSHRRHPAHRAASEGAVHQRRRQGGGEPSRTSGAHENRRRGRNRGGGHGGVLAEASDVRRDRDDSKAAGADRTGVARGVHEVQRQTRDDGPVAVRVGAKHRSHSLPEANAIHGYRRGG